MKTICGAIEIENWSNSHQSPAAVGRPKRLKVWEKPFICADGHEREICHLFASSLSTKSLNCGLFNERSNWTGFARDGSVLEDLNYKMSYHQSWQVFSKCEKRFLERKVACLSIWMFALVWVEVKSHRFRLRLARKRVEELKSEALLTRQMGIGMA